MDTIFIVRPFGSKRPVIKRDAAGNPSLDYFDFDKVEDDLILPAMKSLHLDGGTTQRIFEAGEIKEDMFTQLLVADIVIADITIHNANVFYELGIRHSLRQKTTILIKCPGYDDTPFDIVGLKYISYDKDNPAAAVQTLIQFIQDSTESLKKESPVFNILPNLKEQEVENFLAVPLDFSEEVTIASASKSIGKLALLAEEAAFFPWQIRGLRYIGEELYRLKAINAAQIVWENVKSRYPRDFQANDRLATIYQRIADLEGKRNAQIVAEFLTRSDIAIDSLLKNYPDADKTKRAEIAALKGRNTKTRWINSWKNKTGNIAINALQSIYLQQAYKDYKGGFYEDLNHFYSGINALALLAIIINLAEQHSESWQESFDSNEAATEYLNLKKKRFEQLAMTVQLAIETEKKRLAAQNKADTWLDITQVDLMFLTDSNARRVALRYKTILENVEDFYREASVKQLHLFKTLDVFPEKTEAIFNEISPEISETIGKTHFVLFTGHMIDKPERPAPRFPQSKELTVRQKIKDELTDLKSKISDPIIGIAGGACGGDILFHEVCAELGIQTELYLALPADPFKKESVLFAGNGWMNRFNKLYNTLTRYELCTTIEMPKWLRKRSNYDIWRRNNLWKLNSALVNGGMYMTLLALWDGKGGDGPGGTEHLVREAEERGATVVTIDMNSV